MTETDSSEPIAIIGLSGAFPGSSTVADFFRNVLRKRCFVREIPDWLWEQQIFYSEDRTRPLSSYSRLGAMLDDLDLDLTAFRIPPAVADRMSRNQKLALWCARQALDDAGYRRREFDHDRTSVIMAAGPGERSEIMEEILQTRRMHARLAELARTPEQKRLLGELWRAYAETHPEPPLTEDSVLGCSASLVAGRIAAAFDLHGMNLTLDAACASALAAVAIAVNALRARTCDMVLAGGASTDLSAKVYVAFSILTALSANGSYPFDSRGDGFVLGEGCGVLALKRYADAVRDGDGIYAVIRGWGSSSDGAGHGITAPSVEGQVLALRRAYADAGFSLADLHYLECHGTGTQVGDAAELTSVSRMVLETGRSAPLPIGSVKAMVGHLRLAAGVAGLFRAICAINCRVVPPQVNFESPNPNLDWTAARLRVPLRTEPIAEREVRAGVSGFGFGGVNFHIALSSPPVQGRDPVVRVADFRPAELPPLAGDTAFLFPGQGSQYAGMLAGFDGDPVARDMLARAEALTKELAGRSLAKLIAPADSGAERNPDRAAEIRDTAVVQPGIFVLSAMLLRQVRGQGLVCSMAIGHSLGEYSALYAAGVIGFEDALRAVCVRGRLMSALPASQAGAMAVVAAGPEAVRALLDKVGGYLVCANLNSYDQTVVAGEPAAVRALVELATAGGLRSSLLNVERAFHSKLVGSVVDPLRAALEKATFFTSDIIVPANLSREVYPCARAGQGGQPLSGTARDRVIDMLCRQVDHPVDFVSQIELAYEAGIRRFVEIGPRNVLTRLVEDILQGKPCQTIALDPAPPATRQRLDELAICLRAPLTTPRRPLRLKPRVEQTPVASRLVVDASLSPAERVRAVVAQVTGYAPDKIGDDAEFERDLGIDTLKIIDIISQLRGKVLPARFTSFRQATSVRKILSFALVAPEGALAAEHAAPKADRQLRCYRYESAVSGVLSSLDSDQVSRRYRIVWLTQPDPAAAAAVGFLSDDNSPHTLVLAPLPGSPERLCEQFIPALIDLVQALAVRSSSDEEREVSLVTCALPEEFNAAAFRSLTGLMKALQKDAPYLCCAYTHLDGGPPAGELLRRALAAPFLGRRIHADGRIEAGRFLAQARVPVAPGKLAALLGSRDVVLVTGGARGIASRVVRQLLPLTAARFILIGRKPQTEAWIAAEGRGRVEYLAADLCVPEAVRALGLRRRGVTLVIHAAGLVKDRPLQEVRREDVALVLGTKVLGLHRVLDDLDAGQVRGVVNFASIAGYFGGDGQPDYAAANAYLDGVVWGSVPILSIGWSAWDGVGMATSPSVRKFLEFAGVEMIPWQAGVEMFAELLAAFLGTGAPRSQNILVSAGLAQSCCLPDDPLQASFQALAEATPMPASIPEPASVAIPAALALGETAVKVLRLAEAADYAAARVETLFTTAERAELQSVTAEKRRREKMGGKLAAKWLARDVMRDWCGETVSPAEVQILAPATPVQASVPGDPRLDARLRDISFSISHTADLVCVAAGRRRLGIDAERIRPVGTAVQREIGVESMQAAIDAWREGAGTDANRSIPDGALPLVVFTQKEAVLKAAGVGIGNGLSEVQIDAFAVGTSVSARLHGTEYRVMTVVGAGHVFSLAVEHAAAAPTGVRKEVPASIGQEGLWFQEQMAGGGSAYLVAWQERYRGPLDVAALRRSLQFLADRHEALRTVFRERDGRCLAEVLPRPEIALPVVGLETLAEDQGLAEAGRLGRRLIGQGFDLVAGPLLRTALFRLGPADHVLLLVFHHIVMDGLSAAIFRKELALAYGAFHAGVHPDLPPLPMQYGDCARLQRERLTAGRIAELAGYWRAQLAGAPERLDLPADRPRIAGQEPGTGHLDFPLPPAAMRTMRELAMAEGVTVFVSLLSAFQVLLMRLSGQDDVVVGAPFGGRETQDAYALVGYFANILPLRADLADNPSFRELLRRNRATVMGALEHQDLPFPSLVEALMPRRDTAQAPFFQTTFGLLQEDEAGVAIAGLQREVRDLPVGSKEYDLVCTVRAELGSVELEYNTARFDASAVRLVAERFQRVLEASARDPGQRVADISLMSAAEQEQVLRDWNATACPIPRQTVPALYAEQAARTPDAIALDGDAGRLSYRELNARANRIAQALRKRGVGPGGLVGVALERSPDLVAALLGILKTGAAYVPLDPEDPPARVAAMLDDVRPRLVITKATLRARLPPTGQEVFLLDREQAALARESAEEPAVAADPDGVAYVMFTSGSTGRPKGVEIPHRGIVRLLFGVDYVRLGPAQTILHMAAISFDAATFELWGALLRGGRCVLLPERVPTLAQLGRTLRQYRVNTLWLTASLFNLVIDEAPEILAGVEQLLTGGEALSVPHVRRALARLPAAQITNGYGPTESTTFACCYRIPRTLEEWAQSIPIGRPIANTTAYVLDRRGKPVPPGTPGELHLGGLGLARGYWNRPDLTAERFIAHPFDPDPAARLYKTGDRVRWLPDGRLEFLGRFDRQVKIRGHRVELGEIEAALARHPALRQSVAALCEDTATGKSLVVYGVPAAGQVLPALEELRSFLKRSLPDYMLPAALVALDRLPLTATGKVDRQALPAPAAGRAGLTPEAVGPRNLTEAALSILWCEVLGLKQVGIHDNFFDQGGHSLLGVRLVTKIQEAFQVDLPMRSLFQAPTIAEQADLVKGGLGADALWTCMLEVRKGRAGPPLFFVSGGAGGEKEYMTYARLMRHLGVDCPVYGFRARGLRGTERPHTRVQTIAADYLSDVRAVQPAGPYFLAGECVGGILAYEMAQQLRAQGEAVALLALLDTVCPSPRFYLRSVVATLRPRLNKHWGRLQQYPKRSWLVRLPAEVFAILRECGDDLGLVVWNLKSEASLERSKRFGKRLFHIYVRTLQRYCPGPYAGKVTMLLSSDFPPTCAAVAAWQALARGGAELHAVAGDHATYVRDNAANTGRVLGECLSRARSGHVPASP